MDLSGVDTASLVAELGKRGRDVSFSASVVRVCPRPLVEMNWSELVEMVEGHVEAVFKYGWDFAEETDNKHYIYEAAIEAVYGDGIWDVLNRRD